MDSGDHDKDPNEVLQSLLSSEHSKNVDLSKTVIAESSVSDVPIVHVFHEGSGVHYTADGAAIQQTVDLEALQWQNLDRNGYTVGDTLLWEGNVQVDQIENLHTLQVLETPSVSAGGELKKTEIYNNVPVSITNSLQNSVLILDSIPTLSSNSTNTNESCIPSTPLISIDSPPPNIPLPVLDIQTFQTSSEKYLQAKKKKRPLKSIPKPGGKKPRKLVNLSGDKSATGSSVGIAQKNLSPKISSADCLNQKNTKKKVNHDYFSPTKLEDNVSQVQDRFNQGCECQDSNCFDGLSAEFAFRHKLNIADLTKEEHDMYLMGVTMASLGNPEHTIRNKERQRLRAKYVYQGKNVCLQAFLYLENCTLYQIKRIRKHVMTNGVVPRIHGNHGKKPHNRFSLELYCQATEFLKNYLRPYNGNHLVSKTTPLRPDVTRKAVHQAYLIFCEKDTPNKKVMGYSTFRHFMKETFPYIRFRQLDIPGLGKDTSKQTQRIQETVNVRDQPPQMITQMQKKNPVSSQAQIVTSQPKQDSCSSQDNKDFEMISLTEVVVQDDNQDETVFVDDMDVGVINDTENGSVVLFDTPVPLMPGSNLVMVTGTSDTFPQLKEPNPPSPGGSGNKTMTISSSSLRLVSANGMSASSLVPMNTLAMLGPGVFPIYLDTQVDKNVQSDQLSLTDGGKKGQIVRGSTKSSNHDVIVRVQSKSS